MKKMIINNLYKNGNLRIYMVFLFVLIGSVFIWYSIFNFSNISKKIDRNELLSINLLQSLTDLKHQQNQVRQDLTQVSQQVFPSNSISIEFEIINVDINHHSEAFRESLEVSASLSPKSIPDGYHFQKVIAYVDYSIELPKLKWIKMGRWSGVLNMSRPEEMRFKVVLPELGVDAEEAVIEFNGLGILPLLPFDLSQLILSRPKVEVEVEVENKTKTNLET